MFCDASVAQRYADERIATQRSCHEIICRYHENVRICECADVQMNTTAIINDSYPPICTSSHLHIVPSAHSLLPAPCNEIGVRNFFNFKLMKHCNNLPAVITAEIKQMHNRLPGGIFKIFTF